MNVIFLDFDGVINTVHNNTKEDIEKRISILSDICKENDCSIVIEASVKKWIDEKTLKTDVKWVKEIFELFKKYNIKCVGRTPEIGRNISSYSYTPIWKEDEIRIYLFNHPEIDHFVIIDDDDMAPRNSDLNTLRNHLVTTVFYSDNIDEEGLLEKHKKEVKEKMKLENEYKVYAEKKKMR
ncbi:MAG: hypothetical protein IJ105_05265 [Bacilli bacterium]|nr:hypothetical protein [Bacilli bacterium]